MTHTPARFLQLVVIGCCAAHPLVSAACRSGHAPPGETLPPRPPRAGGGGGAPPGGGGGAPRGGLHRRRHLGGDIGAEQLGGREGDDLGPRAWCPPRAVGPPGPLLAGSAVGGIGTAAVFLVPHAPAAPSPLSTLPPRAARPAPAPRTARLRPTRQAPGVRPHDDVWRGA